MTTPPVPVGIATVGYGDSEEETKSQIQIIDIYSSEHMISMNLVSSLYTFEIGVKITAL